MRDLRFESEFKNTGEFQEKLIWANNSEGTNEYCLFRKTFMCDKMPKSAILSIFVQSKYRLFINGESVLRGDSGVKANGEITDVNVLPYLKQGKNVIAIFACYYPYPMSSVELRQKGVIFNLALDYSGARQENVVSDETVKSIVCNAYLNDAPKFEDKGLIEVFDNNLFDEEWTMVDFEDSSWEDSYAVELCNTMYFGIGKSQCYPVNEYIHSAKAIIAAGTGNDIKGASLKESIYNEIPRIQFNKLYVAGCECELQPIDKGQYSYIVVDFDKVCKGYVKIDITGYGEDILDVVFVEDIKDTVPVVSGAARFILKAENNILETNFELNEFRYAVLVFRNPVRTNNINGIWAYEKEYEFENVSEFACAEEKLNNAFKQLESRFKTAFSNDNRKENIYNKRTLGLCTSYMAGDETYLKNVLSDIASMQVEDGMFINKREQKCLDFYDICYFALAVKDYYVLSGDTKTTAEFLKTAIAAFKWLSASEQDGLLLPALVGDKTKSIELLNALYICANDALADVSFACKDLLAYKHYKLKVLKLKKLYKDNFLKDEEEFESLCKEHLGDVCTLLILADMESVVSSFLTENLKFTMQIEFIRALKKSKALTDLFNLKVAEMVDSFAIPVYVAENVLGITFARKEFKTQPDTAAFGEIKAKMYLPKGVVEVLGNSAETKEELSSDIEQGN